MELQSTGAVRWGKPNQTHEEFPSGPLCHHGVVQTCFPSKGARHQLGKPGLVLLSGAPPMPRWGWRHSRKNDIHCECLSPSVYYKNHCVPTSPELSKNSHEQAVKHCPGKPLITSSSSIWISVGRVLALWETVTVCIKRSVIVVEQLYYRIFIFTATKTRMWRCGHQCSSLESHSWELKYEHSTKD